MLTPKSKATKLGIAPRSQSYQRSAEVADDLNVRGTSFFSKTDPKILTPCHPLFVPGRYYSSALVSYGASDATWVDYPANSIHVFAYPIPRRVRVSKIAINIGGASGTSGSKLSMALYSADLSGYPYDFIRDFGEVASDSTGVKVIDFSDDKLILPADLYWLGLNNSHAGVDIVGGMSTLGVLGFTGEPVTSSGFIVDYTYGSWPKPFDLTLTKTLFKITARYGLWIDALVE